MEKLPQKMNIKNKKTTDLVLTVENKCDSMKDALLWCYMPYYYIL